MSRLRDDGADLPTEAQAREMPAPPGMPLWNRSIDRQRPGEPRAESGIKMRA